jgi:hypothetical protein
MWGSHFRCGTQDHTYPHACTQNDNEICTDLLCSKYRDTNGSCSNAYDFICFKDEQCKKNGRCNRIVECSDGEDEYWCPFTSYIDQENYRFGKSLILSRQNLDILSIKYPQESPSILLGKERSTSVVSHSIDPFWTNHSFICNRAVSVLQSNDIRCLCPPPFYGSRCQFFSDRLSMIIHLNLTTGMTYLSNLTLKIQANLLLKNNFLIDQHEFHLSPTVEKTTLIKHQFYLLYSRSPSMIKHKQNRFFNRTDLITNHPYTVHLILFASKEHNLPSFRLAIVLKLLSSSLNSSFNLCQTNTWNNNYNCLPTGNRNISYCSCRSGYSGSDCSIYESRCNTHCASNAFCQPSNVDV